MIKKVCKPPKFTHLVSFLPILLLFLFSSPVHSAEITLQWDPNSESFLSGYKVYYGTNSGGPYTSTDADQGASPVTVSLGELSNINDPKFKLTGLDNSKIYYFAVTAYTTEEPYLEAGYSNEIYYSNTPTYIIDNGGNGISSSGVWNASGGENPYGGSSLYSKAAGATYTYEFSVKGNHEVSLWWTYWETRCSEIPVEIYNGDTLLDTVYIGQQTNGGQWNVLGSYNFSGTARLVIVSVSTTCTTNADAAKLVSKPLVYEGMTPRKVQGLSVSWGN